MPPLQPAPTLRDITNACPTSYVPPTKKNKLKDLSDDVPSVAEIEEVWGIIIKDSLTDHQQTGRGNKFNSGKLRGLRKQPVTVVKKSHTVLDCQHFDKRGPVTTHFRSKFHLLLRGTRFKNGAGHAYSKYYEVIQFN